MSNWESNGISPTILTPEILVPRLGYYLVEKSIISDEDLQNALDKQKIEKSNGHNLLLGQMLIEMGLIDKITLDRIITEQIIQLRSALQDANEKLEKRVQERTAELQKALEKLSELDRLKSNFIANISHELRTPLTHIKGYIDLLLNGDLGHPDNTILEAVHVMSRSSGRLEQLINDLILFSTIEHGKLALKLQKINLVNICKKIIAQTGQLPDFIDHKIELCFETPTTDSIMVMADSSNIAWVIQQLLENAKKFTPHGGKIILQISLKNKMASIAVIDTGIGIPKDRIEEIFEPFHQLDSNSTRKYSGTGLGLALAKYIITEHGSNITVISEPGKGSSFEFSLIIAEP